jgi:hypothetical protein
MFQGSRHREYRFHAKTVRIQCLFTFEQCRGIRYRLLLDSPHGGAVRNAIAADVISNPQRRARPGAVTGFDRFVVAVISFLVTVRDHIVNDPEFCRQLNLVRMAFESFPQRLSLCSQFFDSHFGKL